MIGDTVNTTSRVCSLGEDGVITISEEAYKKVRNCQYYFNEKMVWAKGKGDMKVYQVFKSLKEYIEYMEPAN